MSTLPFPDQELPVDASSASAGLAGIVCGTDFSEASAQATAVAAEFARLFHEPVVLVHAVNPKSRESLPSELSESLNLYLGTQLREGRERWQLSDGQMTDVFRFGASDRALLKEVDARRAKLLILGGAKRRALSGWRGGTVMEQAAETARVPTLVVRDAAPLVRWARGICRLRVFVGVDFSAPSEAALLWVDWLRKLGRCEIVVACLEPVPPPHPSDDVLPSLFLDEMVLKTAHAAERRFRLHVRDVLGTSHVRARFEKGWGHSDAHLIGLAVEDRADLIVVGTHSLHSWHRLGHHSISRGVLRYSPLNILCVPGQTLRQPGSSPDLQESTLHHERL